MVIDIWYQTVNNDSVAENVTIISQNLKFEYK